MARVSRRSARPPRFVPCADWSDGGGEDVLSCATQLRQFGARIRFQGEIATVRCHQDNGLLRTVLGEPGHGRVAVVDGAGSVDRALFGESMARLAIANGWEGVIVHGAVRDTAALGRLDLGVKALGTNAQRGSADGVGERDHPVSFGGAVFTPGAVVVADEDGVVIVTSRDFFTHRLGMPGVGR